MVGALVNVILNAVLISLWGINGAALATSLCYLLMWWLSGREMQKYVSVRGWFNGPLFSWSEVKTLKEMVWKK
jgi:O-antigen/teichoic acid export membrane protein